jgi:leader peptidase (prepilin peptidase)/N-methyltransferase
LLELLEQSPALFAACAGVFSLMVGSFLNVVIHRLPRMMDSAERSYFSEMYAGAQPSPQAPDTDANLNLWKPRSRCPSCGHQITALENIPVVSWLVLRGKCSACKASISARYPVVEMLTAALSAAVAAKYGFSAAGLGGIVLVWALIALAFIDADTQLLPDDITLPLLWTGLLVNLAFNAFVPLNAAVIGAMAGYLTLWSIYWLFKLLTGKEGMGYGDFKLLAALGAWLGWSMLPAIILLSSVVGAVLGIGMMMFGRHGREQPMPFGPYLAGAGALALLFGQEINTRYLNLF